MTPSCPHGCADPRMCDECRRTHIGPGTEDPDLKAGWDDFRRGLADLLRPYVQDHLVDKLARCAAAELLAGPGWRPPLKKPPDWLREGRVRAAMLADDPTTTTEESS